MLNRFVHLAIFFILALSWLPEVFAADPQVTTEQLPFLNDISISVADVESPMDVIVNKTIRIYATVRNDSDRDSKGVVRFYNERTRAFMGSDQPFSAVAHGADVVFLDVAPDQLGETPVAIRVVPESSAGDDPGNNKVTEVLAVDRDSDSDGVGNRRDADDDNDSIPDQRDSFPFNPQESQDTDGDQVGNNTDPDDDNDQVPDTQDAMPTNHGPVLVVNVGGGGEGGSGYRFTYNTSTDISTSFDTLLATLTSSPSDPPMTPSSFPSTGSAPSGSSQFPATTSSSQQSSASSQSSESSEPTTPLSSQAPPIVFLRESGGSTPTTSPPAPSKPPPANPKVGEAITFNASKSYDPDGGIVTVKWDFGDGVVQEGTIVEHRYEKAGDYFITLALADDQGETREQTWEIRIGPKIAPWMIGFVAIFLMIGFRFFRQQRLFLKKSLSPKKKWSKITPL